MTSTPQRRPAHDAVRNTARWLALLAWMGVIFWLSSGSPPRLPGRIEVPDKIAHLVEYAILGALLWRVAVRQCAAGGGGAVPAGIVVLVGALYGASDEVHQLFVPGRTASIADWLADVAGIAVTAAAAVAIARRRSQADPRQDLPGSAQ